jgi:glutamyl-tRNA reductase
MEKKSSIIAIGLTIHSTPVELREKMAVPEAEWPRAMEELCAYPHIEEAAVLSTCNRMEIYVVGLSFHRAVREVEDWMARASGVPLERLRPHLFLLRDRDATKHLLRVSGGLDSLVMGEGQILAQVKQVHKVGQAAPHFGRHLNGLFKQAVTAGKRVRSETSISSGSVSVSSAAAELTQLKLPSRSFDDARVAIIGAGKMTRLLVKHLASKGCKAVTVVNRSLPRAEALAEEFPEVAVEVRLMPDLLRVVAAADVIFAASGSEELLVRAADLAGMPPAPAAVGGVRRFVDISVPRNICPEICAEAHGAVVYNVDDLKEVVSANKEARAAAAEEAEGLLSEELAAFEAWRDSLETVPTIKALRGKAEAIRGAEFEKALARLGDGLSSKQRKAVEELSKSIVNKLLHGPMTALRCDGADAGAVSRTLGDMDALERMFELGAELERDRLAAAKAPKQ